MGATALALGGGPPRPPPCACNISGSAIATVSPPKIFAIRYLMLILSSGGTALFPGGQALVNGIDERAGGTLFRAVLRLIGLGRMRGFNLVERLSLLDHVRDRIPHDHHHIAVIHHVQLLARPPVTGNHIGSDSLVNKRSRR